MGGEIMMDEMEVECFGFFFCNLFDFFEKASLNLLRLRGWLSADQVDLVV
jgi:hypothetical protein